MVSDVLLFAPAHVGLLAIGRIQMAKKKLKKGKKLAGAKTLAVNAY